MSARHKWRFVRVMRGPNGARVIVKRCEHCGMECTNQTFSRAETPLCYRQQSILFDNEPVPKPKPPPPPVPPAPPVEPLVPDDFMPPTRPGWWIRRGRR
jgi:hypothetical protein